MDRSTLYHIFDSTIFYLEVGLDTGIPGHDSEKIIFYNLHEQRFFGTIFFAKYNLFSIFSRLGRHIQQKEGPDKSL